MKNLDDTVSISVSNVISQKTKCNINKKQTRNKRQKVRHNQQPQLNKIFNYTVNTLKPNEPDQS